MGPLRPDGFTDFRRRHIVTHIGKRAGELLAIEERVDHGDRAILGDRAALVEQAGKLLALALQYADTNGITTHEVETYLAEAYADDVPQR